MRNLERALAALLLVCGALLTLQAVALQTYASLIPAIPAAVVGLAVLAAHHPRCR